MTAPSTMNGLQFPVFVALSGALFVTAGLAAERTPDVWARSIHHEDGSRTDSTKDTNAQTIESKTFDKSGKMVMKRIFQTDTKGLPREGFISDSDDKPIYKVTLVYDEIGRLSETSLFTAAGEPVMKVKHRYDSGGKEIAPDVEHFAGMGSTKPGEIRPAAAIAAPGSTEAVLAGPAPVEEPADEPGEKKRGLFKFFKKKK